MSFPELLAVAMVAAVVLALMAGYPVALTLAGVSLGFAVFGHVIDGMDLVRKIAVAPRSPTKGEGAMKGQMLAPTVKIVTARRGG